MSADPAAAASGVSDATESTAANEAAAESTSGEHEQSSAQAANDVLREMGVPHDVRELVTPKEKAPTTHEPETPEDDPGTGRPAAPAGHQETGQAAQEPGQKATGVKPATAAATTTTDEDDDEKAVDKTKWPDGAVKMLDKRRHQRNEARDRADKAERELATLREQVKSGPAVATSAGGDPLAHVRNETELQAAIQQQEQLLEWAELNPDGANDQVIGQDKNGNNITRDFSAQDMAQLRVIAGRTLRQVVPQKRAWLAEQQQQEAIARQESPALFDEKAPEHEEYQYILKTLPEIKRWPGYQRWIGWALKGRNAELAAAEAGANGNGNGKNGKPAADPKTAPFLRKHPPIAPSVPAAKGTTPVNGAARKSDSKQAREQFIAAGGGDKALEQLIANVEAEHADEDAALV